MKLTIREIMDRGLWDEFCEIRGWSVWCVNEGRCDSSEVVELTSEEARKLFGLPTDLS